MRESGRRHLQDLHGLDVRKTTRHLCNSTYRLIVSVLKADTLSYLVSDATSGQQLQRGGGYTGT